MSRTAPVRLAYAAAHVVPASGSDRQLDWESTLGLRRLLDSQGFGVAEAMDTAQRFELGWETARELIQRCGKLQLQQGFCAGAGTDQLPRVRGLTDLADAAIEQCDFITSCGGIPVILPMPWLSLNGASEDDYAGVYGAILRQVRGPVFVHWLGEMFLPALKGYFPGQSFSRVMALAPEVARGCKISLLDPAREAAIRCELLPREQIVLSGDDFHFARTILGDGLPPTRWTQIGEHRVALGDFSHALLGIFDAIALPAGRALQALSRGDAAEYLRCMEPCEALGRHVFQQPTASYKAGLAFLAWLNEQQPEFRLLGGLERSRDRAHYLQCADLARKCGAVSDGPRFERRLATWAASSQ